MDKFVKWGLKNARKIVKNTWFDWLSNYIPKPIIQLQVALKRESKDHISKNIKNPFRFKKGK